MTNEKLVNTNYLAVMGKSYKMCIFNEKDFKEELAPAYATIEHTEIYGEGIVRMAYQHQPNTVDEHSNALVLGVSGNGVSYNI